MEINKLLINAGASIYYQQEFRILLEDHLTYLRNLSTTAVLHIDAQRSAKFKGDLDGLLLSYNIPAYMHYIVMRVNSMSSPLEYNEEMSYLMIPSQDSISSIKSSIKSKNLT